VMYLKGVGPARAQALAERGILLVSSQPIAPAAAQRGEAAAASATGEPR